MRLYCKSGFNMRKNERYKKKLTTHPHISGYEEHRTQSLLYAQSGLQQRKHLRQETTQQPCCAPAWRSNWRRSAPQPSRIQSFAWRAQHCFLAPASYFQQIETVQRQTLSFFVNFAAKSAPSSPQIVVTSASSSITSPFDYCIFLERSSKNQSSNESDCMLSNRPPGTI